MVKLKKGPRKIVVADRKLVEENLARLLAGGTRFHPAWKVYEVAKDDKTATMHRCASFAGTDWQPQYSIRGYKPHWLKDAPLTCWFETTESVDLFDIDEIEIV